MLRHKNVYTVFYRAFFVSVRLHNSVTRT